MFHCNFVHSWLIRLKIHQELYVVAMVASNMNSLCGEKDFDLEILL